MIPTPRSRVISTVYRFDNTADTMQVRAERVRDGHYFLDRLTVYIQCVYEYTRGESRLSQLKLRQNNFLWFARSYLKITKNIKHSKALLPPPLWSCFHFLCLFVVAELCKNYIQPIFTKFIIITIIITIIIYSFLKMQHKMTIRHDDPLSAPSFGCSVFNLSSYFTLFYRLECIICSEFCTVDVR